MGCDVTEEQLWSWVDRLAPELDPHLASCPACRERAAAMGHTFAALSTADEPASGFPKTIGPFRIVSLLGEGGMGVVYEAEQSNPDRRVALKLFKAGARLPDDVERLFRREVRTLALLRHPDIAQIYDAGSTEDGLHYIAMELVRGEPIGRFAAAHHLGTRARLRLASRLCRAVHNAHERGVIHRDLKPANILVTPTDSGSSELAATCVLKVLDFGLAKLTETAASVSMSASEIGRVVGTLPYMSPEQVQGRTEELDIRSDVYSLGVLFYELLTGKLPYDVKASALVDAARTIAEVEPQRPSSIAKTLRGDVEVILLKALSKEKALRYDSAAAFADDIDRYLDDLPIAARPLSAAYQVRKFVRRNPAAAALFGSLAVFPLLIAALVHRNAVRIEDELERTALAERRAVQMSRSLERVLGAADPYGDGATVRAMLDRAVSDLETDLARYPAVATELRLILAQAYCRIGVYPRALEQLGLIAPDLLAEASPRLPEAYQVEGRALIGMGEYRKSLAPLREAYRLHAHGGGSILDTLTDLQLLGEAQRSLGHWDAASETLRDGIALATETFGKHSLEVAGLQGRLAAVYQARGYWEEAEQLYLETIELQRELLPQDNLDVADNLRRHAQLLQGLVRKPLAEAHLKEALAIQRRLLGWRHPRLADTLDELGHLLTSQRRLDEAGVLLQRSHKLRVEYLGEEHPDVALSLSLLSAYHQRRGDGATAVDLIQEAAALRRQVQGERHPALIPTLCDLTRTLLLNDHLEMAQATAMEAISLCRDALEGNHPDLASSLSLRAQCFAEAGDSAEALVWAQDALAVWCQGLRPEHPNSIRERQRVASYAVAAGDLELAEREYRRTLQLREGRNLEQTQQNARVLLEFADLLWNRGDSASLDEAEQMVLRASEIIDALGGEDAVRPLLYNLLQEAGAHFPSP